MGKVVSSSGAIASTVTAALLVLGLGLTATHTYLLFHCLTELFCIVVLSSIFIIAWNSRRIMDNGYLSFLGIGLLTVAAIDLCHVLAYNGMNVFAGYDANLPTQLWIASRYMLMAAFLLAPVFAKRKIPVQLVLAGFLVALGLILLSTFGRFFPVCFIPGKGLTPFKNISEYVIASGLLLSLLPLVRQRQLFRGYVLWLVSGSILAAAASDLMFTLYATPESPANMVGHLLEFLAFFLLYKAIVQTGIKDPYRVIFQHLRTAGLEAQRRASEAQESARILAALMEHVPEGITIADAPDVKLRMVSKYGEQISRRSIGNDLGLSPQQAPEIWHLLRRNGATATPEELPLVRATRRGQVILNEEWTLQRQDGTTVPILCNAAPIRDGNGEITGGIVAWRDISGIKAVREAIEKQAAELSAIFNSMVDAILVFDVSGEPVHTNSAAATRYGFDTSRIERREMFREVMRRLKARRRDGGSIEYEDLPSQRALRGESLAQEHLAFTKEDGSEAYIVASASPVYAGGKLIGAVAIWRDVTEEQRATQQLRQAHDELEQRVRERTADLAQAVEALEGEVRQRQQAEMDLQESEKRYRQLFDLAPLGIGIATVSGKLQTANRAMLLITGYGLEEMQKLPLEELYVDAKERQRLVAATLQSGRVRDWETQLKRKDGSPFYARMNLDRLVLGGEEFLLATMQDISEQKQAESRDNAVRGLLELFAIKPARKEYLDSTVELLRNWSGCHNVAIRLLNEQGQIPYEACVGFSAEFQRQEAVLCLHHDECACTRIMRGVTEPQDQGALSPNGSFMCNHAARFISELTPAQQARFRGECIRAGYQTLAITPIRYHGQIIGVIHLTDRKEGLLPLEAIEFIESMALLIGEALHRFDVEEALRDSERRFHAIFDQTYQFMGLLRPDGTMLESNQTSLDFIGARLSDVVGRPFWETAGWTSSPDRQRRLREAIAQAAEGKFVRYEEDLVGASGQTITIDFSLRPIFDDNGKVVLLIPEGRDISERRRLENEILQVSQHERRQLGQDLHDSLGQNLTGMAFLCRALRHKLSAREMPEAADATEIERLANLTTQQARSLSRGLCPVEPRADGLMTSLQDIAANTHTVFGIACEFRCNKPVFIQSDFAAMHLYYIAQEAVNNSLKHAKPKRVVVSLIDASDKVTLTIVDDGPGLPANLDVRKGMGLRTMAFRARAIGGSLEVKGLPSGGTVVNCSVGRGALSERMERSNGKDKR